jgi:PhzF family phenazine biosynthesis protein
MELEMYQVAAFTSQAFGGNPAAVVPLEDWIDDALMLRIAKENNLSETAFFVPAGDGEWHIRWFTPSVEVPLCGHATLASAAVIRDRLGQTDWPITLHSASGALTVDTDGSSFVLDLPANPPQPVRAPEGLFEALGVDSVEETLLGRDIYMVVLADEAAVAALSPDYAALAEIIEHGIIATAPGNEVDFVSRFFAPAIGIDEDPVTGAAHCLMTPYWSTRSGRTRMQARQISDRVGNLECEARGDRVRLTGRAVFFLDGRISI